MALSNWAQFCFDDAGTTYARLEVESKRFSVAPYKSWLQVWDIPKRKYVIGSIYDGEVDLDGLHIQTKRAEWPEGIFFSICKFNEHKATHYWGISCYGFGRLDSPEVAEKTQDPEWIYANTMHQNSNKEEFLDFYHNVGPDLFEDEVARALSIDINQWVGVTPLYKKFLKWAKKHGMGIEPPPIEAEVNQGSVYIMHEIYKKATHKEAPAEFVLPKGKTNMYNEPILEKMLKDARFMRWEDVTR